MSADMYACHLTFPSCALAHRLLTCACKISSTPCRAASRPTCPSEKREGGARRQHPTRPLRSASERRTPPVHRVEALASTRSQPSTRAEIPSIPAPYTRCEHASRPTGAPRLIRATDPGPILGVASDCVVLDVPAQSEHASCESLTVSRVRLIRATTMSRCARAHPLTRTSRLPTTALVPA